MRSIPLDDAAHFKGIRSPVGAGGAYQSLRGTTCLSMYNALGGRSRLLDRTALDHPMSLIVPNESTAAVSRRGGRHEKDSEFPFFTGLQYLVATGGESGVSATKQKTSALPFCRNTPAPP